MVCTRRVNLLVDFIAILIPLGNFLLEKFQKVLILAFEANSELLLVLPKWTFFHVLAHYAIDVVLCDDTSMIFFDQTVSMYQT